MVKGLATCGVFVYRRRCANLFDGRVYHGANRDPALDFFRFL